MISEEKEIKLIAMYLFISDIHENGPMYSSQRFSNNSEPEFTDAEIMTIYLYSMHFEQRFKIKQIFGYANDHLRSWFPKLPSYVAFNTRLNRLAEEFKLLSSYLIEKFIPSDCIQGQSLLDSILVQANDKGKWPGKSQTRAFVPQRDFTTMV